MVPEGRRGDGCVLTISITENLTADRVALLNLRTERERTREAIDRFDIRPTDPRRHLSTSETPAHRMRSCAGPAVSIDVAATAQ